jgi:tryptophanyl-tRNA synthetase
MAKKRIFSGIQPSGNLHLGNYLGAIANWVKMHDEFDSIFCVVDMHAITVPQDPEMLRKKTIEVAKIYLASGLDPKKCSLFIQSHVQEHAELNWILNTITGNNDLLKMTQAKSKGNFNFDLIDEEIEKLNFELTNTRREWTVRSLMDKNFEVTHDVTKIIYDQLQNFRNLKMGLFDYPVLMAADIILYDTETVPVGEDQIQHVELARDLAKRFNSRFSETFIVPKHFVKEEGMRIMGLDDPSKKMSKSAASEYNYIALNDPEEIIRKKIKKAVTDSGSEIIYSDDKPALKNLINIYSLLSGKTNSEIEKMYVGKGYGDFKTDLAEVVVSFLKPFQERMAALSDEKVLEILREGAEKVRPLAKKKLDEVKKKIGFIV